MSSEHNVVGALLAAPGVVPFSNIAAITSKGAASSAPTVIALIGYVATAVYKFDPQRYTYSNGYSNRCADSSETGRAGV